MNARNSAEPSEDPGGERLRTELLHHALLVQLGDVAGKRILHMAGHASDIQLPRLVAKVKGALVECFGSAEDLQTLMNRAEKEEKLKIQCSLAKPGQYSSKKEFYRVIADLVSAPARTIEELELLLQSAASVLPKNNLFFATIHHPNYLPDTETQRRRLIMAWNQPIRNGSSYANGNGHAKTPVPPYTRKQYADAAKKAGFETIRIEELPGVNGTIERTRYAILIATK